MANLMVFLEEDQFEALLLMAGRGILDLTRNFDRAATNDELLDTYAACGEVYCKLKRELKEHQAKAEAAAISAVVAEMQKGEGQ